MTEPLFMGLVLLALFVLLAVAGRKPRGQARPPAGQNGVKPDPDALRPYTARSESGAQSAEPANPLFPHGCHDVVRLSHGGRTRVIDHVVVGEGAVFVLAELEGPGGPGETAYRRAGEDARFVASLLEGAKLGGVEVVPLVVSRGPGLPDARLSNIVVLTHDMARAYVANHYARRVLDEPVRSALSGMFAAAARRAP